MSPSLLVMVPVPVPVADTVSVSPVLNVGWTATADVPMVTVQVLPAVLVQPVQPVK